MSNEGLDRSHSEAGGETPANDLHRRLVDLLPAYSIGAVDPEEAEFVQAQLARDPEAARELAEYAALNQALLHGSGSREPSPQLAARLRASIREEADPTGGSATATWREWLFGRSAPLWPRLAIAAALALLIALNILAVTRIRALQAENRFLAAQLSNQRDALALIAANDVQVTTLPAAQDYSDAQATVRWDPYGSVAVVSVEGFPALTPGMAYQLWLIRDGERTSGGLFTVDPAGSGTLVVRAPEPVGSFDAMGITPEPATGSPGPTAPPVVVGDLVTG